MSDNHNQPNFLFLMTDQHRADWLGCYGHPVLRTPHIDAIAQRGTRFDNFHVASPVCMPNRASLMTGRFPTAHGLRYNGCTLPLNANTFVDLLASAGYHTASFGKSHLQPFTNHEPLHKHGGGTGPLDEAWNQPEGDYTQEEPSHYEDEQRYPFKTPYYGFQQVDMVTAHGDRCGGHYGQWFRNHVANWRELHDRSNELSHDYTCPQAFRTPVPESLYPTAYIADRAIDYLNQRQHEDTPFFAFVSFPDPHHPFNPPGQYWDMYAPEQFKVDLPFETHHNPTPPMRWMREQWQASGGQVTPQTAFMADNREVTEAMALTAGMITCVDDAIGRVTDALKATGQFDNTIICFTSDHGDYMGDFNMLLKGSPPFRAITRVPFLWADPQKSGVGSTATLASTVDIPATILERAGVTPFNGIQGVSLLNTISNGAVNREELLVEYNDGIARLGFDEPPRVRSVITDEYRFTIYTGLDWGELYDLKRDPQETRNEWDNSAYRQVRGDMAEKLAHQLAALMDESPAAKRLA